MSEGQSTPRKTRPAIAWAPLGLLLMLLTPHRSVEVDIIDGRSITYVGFPFLATSDSQLSPVPTIYYTAPLIANLMFFCAIAWIIVGAWRRRPVLQHQAFDWVVGLPVYLLSLAYVLMQTLWWVAGELHFYWWIDRSDWEAVGGFVFPAFEPKPAA